jgi:hypothetical protein
MITLEYDSMEGLALPEGKIKEFVTEYIAAHRDKDVTLAYGQELILNYFRLAIVNNKLDHNNIVVKYQDTIIPIDKYGTLKKWLMPSVTDDVLQGLIGWN